MEKKIYDCIIIGGGISGISFAHYLHTINKEALILEEKDTIGGQVRTIISPKLGNYWRELGGYACYNSYTSLLSLAREVQKEGMIIPLDKRPYLVYSKNRIKSIASELSFISCALNFPKVFFSDKKGKTVQEYFSPLVGKSNYKRLFRYAFRAVICQTPDEYPAELFLKKRKTRDETVSRKFSFKGGIQSFLEDILNEDNIELRKQTKVTDIQFDDIYKITTANGNDFYARNIAMAANPQVNAMLLKQIEPEVCALLSLIPLFESESVNIIVEKEKLSLKETAAIISLNDEFMSVVPRDMVEDDKYRSFSFHFKKEGKSREEKISLICKVLNISRSDILEIEEVDHTLASTRVEHLHMDQQIGKVRRNDSVYVLGNYFYGLSLEDCVNRSKDEFERYKLLSGQ
ncbi:MAG: FAD-dependent oxidoreductase [Prevotella sp.]|jgi:protoporphyrinogen oxidase|nr:FAD-dependent oxidoreductase [Prevotella sp.]